MFQKKTLKYQYRTFLTACLCIWLVLGLVAYFEYNNKKQYLTTLISNRVSFAVGNIFMNHERGRDVKPFLDFMEESFTNTEFEGMCISLYDARTGRFIDSMGRPRNLLPTEFESEVKYESLYDGSKAQRINNVTLPNGEKMFFCGRRISNDGELIAQCYLPASKHIDESLESNWGFWLIIIGAAIGGTILAYIITAHQAKNVKLLHDFARRAAEDRDFIPMGDFPSDEIGDISRQIVAIYNARMQANVRREREHVIALKATEEKNRTKRMLTDNISHELKTPIGIIRSYLDMILNQPDMPEADRNHFLSKAQQNVERLVSMLNDLSTMTRLEESNSNIPMKEIDFHQMVFTFVDETLASGITKNMDLRYNLPHDCRIMGNEGLLNSMLSNLVKNSVAYSQGTQMGIELLGRSQSYYTFAFYDNGVGVGEEHLAKLFDRFYRVDTGRSRKAGGTGLGLPIVKSSVNTMGGSISVRNRRGGGLEFIFTLPRAKAPDSDNVNSPAPSAPADDQPQQD